MEEYLVVRLWVQDVVHATHQLESNCVPSNHSREDFNFVDICWGCVIRESIKLDSYCLLIRCSTGDDHVLVPLTHQISLLPNLDPMVQVSFQVQALRSFGYNEVLLSGWSLS